MMMKISDRPTAQSRSRWITVGPYAMVRSATVIRASPRPRAADPSGLDAEDIVDDGQDGVGDDDEDDPGDDGGRRREADRRRAAPALHPAQAPGDGHQHAEHRPLDEPLDEVGQREGGDR